MFKSILLGSALGVVLLAAPVMAKVVDPHMFGADPFDHSPDTIALQKALNSLGGTAGTVRLNGGNGAAYIVDASVNLPSNVTLDSDGAIVQRASSYKGNLFVTQSAVGNVTIRGVTFDEGVRDSNQAQCNELEVVHYGRTLVFSNGSQDITIEDSRFLNLPNAATLEFTPGPQLSQRIRIASSTFERTLPLMPAPEILTDQLKNFRNSPQDHPLSGYYCTGGSGLPFEYGPCYGGRQGVLRKCSVFENYATLYLGDAFDVNIEGNTLTGVGSIGMYPSASAQDSGRVRIAGNTWKGGPNTRIALGGGQAHPLRTVEITDNKFEDIGFALEKGAINTWNYTQDITIRGNTVRGFGWSGSSGGYVEEANTAQAIVLQGARGFAVEGNTVDGRLVGDVIGPLFRYARGEAPRGINDAIRILESSNGDVRRNTLQYIGMAGSDISGCTWLSSPNQVCPPENTPTNVRVVENDLNRTFQKSAVGGPYLTVGGITVWGTAKYLRIEQNTICNTGSGDNSFYSAGIALPPYPRLGPIYAMNNTLSDDRSQPFQYFGLRVGHPGAPSSEQPTNVLIMGNKGKGNVGSLLWYDTSKPPAIVR